MIDGATIAAVATAPGEGGIGVVRLSGPDAAAIAARVFRRGKHGVPVDLRRIRSHRVLYGRVIDPADDRPIDEALLTWMRGPASYTGEDVVELSCHGGPVPVQETLRIVLAAGARHAEPGEFTLRAFLNGRLDLTQAEAVLNIVSARTAEAMRLAVGDLAGDLTRRLQPARDAVVSLLAYLDAAADFPDDEIPGTDVDADLAVAESALAEVIAGSRAGRLYREGAQVALVGRPNVGKSSLLNALLRSDRAIVTPIAGTTRDVIAESIDLAGIPVTLLDTAGIADTADPIEQLGIERSRRALDASAVAVLVLDGSTAPDDDDLALAGTLAERLSGSGGDPSRDRDQQGRSAGPGSPGPGGGDPARLRMSSHISARTGDGIPDLERTIGDLLRGGAGQVRPSLISARQSATIERALAHVREAAAARAAGFPLDLMATDVRAALRAIGEVTGEAVDEAVLTEIFSRFCIGK